MKSPGLWETLRQNPASLDLQTPLGIKLDRLGKNLMFLFQDPGVQSVRSIIIVDGNYRLDDDRAGIRSLIHKVHRTPGELYPGINFHLPHMSPRKSGKQGRMDVHHFHRESPQKDME